MRKLFASIVLIGVLSISVLAGDIPSTNPEPQNLIAQIVKALFG